MANLAQPVVERALLSPLEIQPRYPLTLIQAPAGYGKTVLLDQWFSESSEDVPVHRISLLGASDVRAELWRFLSTSLGIAPDSSIPQLRQAAATLENPAVFVVDDYHLATDPSTDSELLSILRAGPNVTLVVAGHRTSALSGALARAQMPVRTVDFSALSFSEGEIEKLASLMGVGRSLEFRSVAAITEGNPLLVRVVLQTVAAGGTKAAISQAIAEVERQRFDSIASRPVKEVFKLIAVCRWVAFRFLVEKTQFSQEEVLEALDRLEDLGLIARRHYVSDERYELRAGHPERLEKSVRIAVGAGRARKLKRESAADLVHDDPQEGLVQLLEEEDYPSASRVLRQSFPLVGEPKSSLISAIQKIPTAAWRQHPILSSALMAVELSNPNANLSTLTVAKNDLLSTYSKLEADGNESEAIIALVTLLLLKRLGGQGSEALRVAYRLERKLQEATPETLEELRTSLPIIYATGGLAGVLAGDINLAERSFEQSLRVAEEADNVPEQVRAWSGLALVSALQADFWRAKTSLATVDQLIRSSGEPGPQLASQNRAACQALVAAEETDERRMQAALRSLGPHLWTCEQAPIFLGAHARFILLTEGPLSALELLDDGLPRIQQGFLPSAYSLAQLAMLRANLLTYSGGYAAAERLLEKMPESHVASLGRARLRLFQGRNGESAEWAKKAYASADERQPAEALLIAAVAAFELGSVEDSLEHALHVLARPFSESLTSSVPYEPFKKMLSAFLEKEDVLGLSGEQRTFFKDLKASLEAIPEKLRLARVAGLSSSETATLEALAEGLTRPQIAEKLGVSPNTVKFHLRTVYRKLRVQSREEAIERARRLEILNAHNKAVNL